MAVKRIIKRVRYNRRFRYKEESIFKKNKKVFYQIREKYLDERT